MLAQDIDFYEMFKISPTSMAVLSADLYLVDVNDQFVAYARRPLEDLVGHNVYEIFPKLPIDMGGAGRDVLEEAFDSGRAAQAPLVRYDMEDPAHPGVFDERYWSVAARPIRGLDGQVEMYELSARDLTPVIEEFKAMQSEQEGNGLEGGQQKPPEATRTHSSRDPRDNSR
jgi:PAS domain-containing protein